MDCTPTGIPGLDQLIGGGFPKGRIILVHGGPGSGKSIMCSQYIHEGAREYHEKGIYVLMEEHTGRFLQNMGTVGLKFQPLIGANKVKFVNVSPLSSEREERYKAVLKEYGLAPITPSISFEFSTERFREMIKETVKEVGAKRIVIDSITSFRLQFSDMFTIRRNTLELFKGLSETGCTSFVVSENRTEGVTGSEFATEEYLSDGVITLHRIVKGDNVIRAIEVEKMRGLKINRDLHVYDITENGMVIYPTEKVFG